MYITVIQVTKGLRLEKHIDNVLMSNEQTKDYGL